MLTIRAMTQKPISRNAALARAIKAAGGVNELSRAIGVSSQAISQWKRVPPLRVVAVALASGVPEHVLRPDLYPKPKANAASS